jgi:hypothetical protein
MDTRVKPSYDGLLYGTTAKSGISGAARWTAFQPSFQARLLNTLSGFYPWPKFGNLSRSGTN